MYVSVLGDVTFDVTFYYTLSIVLKVFSTFSTKAGKVESRKVCCVQRPNIAISITRCREIKESQICYSMDQGLFKKATNVKMDVCHEQKLLNQDDYFESLLTTFKASIIFWGSK
jgi:hypothetical protein